jgi:hypothetical protein
VSVDVRRGDRSLSPLKLEVDLVGDGNPAGGCRLAFFRVADVRRGEDRPGTETESERAREVLLALNWDLLESEISRPHLIV